MTHSRRAILTLLTGCLLLGSGLASCGSEGSEGAEESTLPVGFTARSVAGEVATAGARGVLKTDGAGAWSDGEEICVNAIYYRLPNTDLGEQFMYNNAVTAAVADGTTSWSYTPVKYWPQTGVVEFYAVSPRSVVTHPMLSTQTFYRHDAMIRVNEARYALQAHAKPMPALPTDAETYDDATRQPDLMFAYCADRTKPAVDEKVNFLFTHAAMAVRFFFGTADLAGGYYNLVIHRLALMDILPAGRVTAFPITPTDNSRLRYEWDYTGEPHRDTYVQTVDATWVGAYPGRAVTPHGTLINSGDKVFIIPPQSFSEGSGAALALDYSYTLSSGEKVTYRSIFYVDHEPAAGQCLDIYLNFAYSAIGFTVKVSDWTTIESAVINAD